MTTSAPIKVEFARILIPTDFSDVSQRAVEYAKGIARLYDSEIVLAHVNTTVASVSPPEAEWFDDVAELQRVDEQLESQGAALRSEGFHARTVSLTGATAEEIILSAIRERSELIVMGTHGRAGMERLLIGSDAEALLRNSDCAVLVVGPFAKPAGPGSWHPKDVLCASSLDLDSVPTAACACMLADEHEATFIIFHVDGTAETKNNEGVLEFQEAFAQLFPGRPVPHYSLHTPVAVNMLGPTIVDWARARHSDLIVMGAKAGSLTTTHFPRGIAPFVAGEAPCPVLVLH